LSQRASVALAAFRLSGDSERVTRDPLGALNHKEMAWPTLLVACACAARAAASAPTAPRRRASDNARGLADNGVDHSLDEEYARRRLAVDEDDVARRRLATWVITMTLLMEAGVCEEFGFAQGDEYRRPGFESRGAAPPRLPG